LLKRTFDQYGVRFTAAGETDVFLENRIKIAKRRFYGYLREPSLFSEFEIKGKIAFT
jgi:hypothetical protein